MKEATGELNMTVIVVIAIAAIAAIFYVFIWPAIQRQLMTNTCEATYGAGYHAEESGTDYDSDGAVVHTWVCCPEGETSGSNCKEMAD